jgi:hypothetical protein
METVVTHETTEELLELVFSMRSVPRIYTISGAEAAVTSPVWRRLRIFPP